MTTHTSMVALVEEFLAFRRRLGIGARHTAGELSSFARYADQSGHRGPIDTALILRWATQTQRADPIRQARRFEIVRRFALHRALFDPATEVPAAGLLGPATYPRRPPHIYSEQELACLLEAAAGLTPAGGLRPWTYVTLFGLLASTGLRISEALRLTTLDVDLRQGVLTVVNSKFRKSRLVPLHTTTIAALACYAERRDRQHAAATSAGAFLCGEDGLALNPETVLKTFTRLRGRLGWSRRYGRAPHIHDLRHTFAVRRLLAWCAKGVDEVDRKIAALATYMGHAKVRDTYWYLSAVPELLVIAAARFERLARPTSGATP